MTLKTLTLINFQPHHKKVVSLDPNNTFIVGESDSGKSSIIRALFWLCFNRPLTDSFISHDKDFCKVKLELNDSTIIRCRGKTNYYSLNGKKFFAFNKGVPQEITELLNLDEVNFQLQHDAPFWFSLSPGEVSKELNRIVNLNLIDSTLGNIASELRKSKLLVNVCRERLQEAREQRDVLAWTLDADSALKKLEETAVLNYEKRNRIAQLSDLIVGGESLQEERQDAVQTIQTAFPLIQRGESLEGLQERISLLNSLCLSYRDYFKISTLEIPKQRIKLLITHRDNITDLRFQKESLSQLINRIAALEEEIWLSEKSSMQAKKELVSLIGEKCPLCNQEIPN